MEIIRRLNVKGKGCMIEVKGRKREIDRMSEKRKLNEINIALKYR